MLAESPLNPDVSSAFICRRMTRETLRRWLEPIVRYLVRRRRESGREGRQGRSPLGTGLRGVQGIEGIEGIETIAGPPAAAPDYARLYREARQAVRDGEALLAAERAARREAEFASRAKDEFLGMLSHELRTPLNAIQGWIELLGAGRLDAPTTARAIATIDRNARSQARLIEDMLDVSRIISGKLRLDTQAVDLASVVHNAVDTSRPAAEAREIAVSVALDGAAGPVLGDPVRLQQVVLNLLSNALKFTPGKGRVDVELARRGSCAELTVRDTGPGIEEGFLPFVFERFRQADSTSGRHGGLGLGLSIVRHLVEVHGGTVEAGNRAGRQGAVFTVKLPLLAVAPAAHAPTEDRPPAPPAGHDVHAARPCEPAELAALLARITTEDRKLCVKAG